MHMELEKSLRRLERKALFDTYPARIICRLARHDARKGHASRYAIIEYGNERIHCKSPSIAGHYGVGFILKRTARRLHLPLRQETIPQAVARENGMYERLGFFPTLESRKDILPKGIERTVATKYLEGSTAALDYIEANPQKARETLSDAAKLMDTLHAAGHTWGDAHPKNLLFDEHGTLLLFDFGFSFEPTPRAKAYEVLFFCLASGYRTPAPAREATQAILDGYRPCGEIAQELFSLAARHDLCTWASRAYFLPRDLVQDTRNTILRNLQ